MIKFKELPDDEKPRERLYLYGSSSLSNEELLMIILRTGTKNKSVKDLALEILTDFDGVKGLKDLNIQNLLKIDGIGRVKAIELCAVVELSKRIYSSVTERELISFFNPDVVVNYFNDLYSNKKQEEFYCVFLDNKKKFLAKKKLFVGTINSSLVHPREIFKNAYLLSASFFICVHNHPSGDPTPSKEDVVLTKKLKEIGELHAIYLVDHLVIGDNCYYSFYENHCVLNTK